jgi:hypothetical protein
MELFEKSYNLYSLFWGVKMKLVDTSNLKSIDEQALNIHDKKSRGFMGKLGELVKRAIDCCIE